MSRRARQAAVAALAALAALALPACGGGEPRRVEAVLPRAFNLFEGSDVTVGGLSVGEVAELSTEDDRVRVTMALDADVDVPADARAMVTAESLLGERYVQLEPIYDGGPTLADGAVIPLDRTGVPAEVDEVLAGLDDLTAELDEGELGELTAELAEVLEGQGADLGRLLDGLAEASAVLADVDDTLLDALDSLADVAELVESRQEAIAPLLDDLSTVAATVRDEREPLVGAAAELRRLTEALEPLLAEHGEELPGELEQLATFLATAERGSQEIERFLSGSADLLSASGLAFDYESATLRIEKQDEPLGEAIALRLEQRLVGLCLRLGADECAEPGFWEGELDDELCLPGITGCEPGQRPVGDALGDALERVPEPAGDAAGPGAGSAREPDDGRGERDGGARPRPETAADVLDRLEGVGR